MQQKKNAQVNTSNLNEEFLSSAAEIQFYDFKRHTNQE